MAVRNVQQSVPIQLFRQTSFSGGINTSVPPEHLQDNEAQDILNMEFDSEDHIVSRAGTTVFHSLSPTLTYPDRFTSLHYYENDSGTVKIVYTTGSKIYSAPNTGTSATDITGALTLPSDNFWMWRNYGGLAIGVNKATTGDNPVKYNGTGNAAALGGTPPKAKYIEIWNNRVWLVSATSPSTIVGSALGNPEDYTTAGAAGTVTIDISKNDGDKITGLVEFRKSLFIFKRTKIYVLTTVATPNTDPTNFAIDIYSENIGCVAPYSIKPVLDDVLFLSDSGVASLAAAQVVGDLKTALISRNVKELSTFLRTTQDISAQVLDDVNQYWLMLPEYANPLSVPQTYVFDYRRIQEGLVRWVKFDGKVAGNVMCANYINGAKSYLVGTKHSSTPAYKLFSYTPKNLSILDDSSGSKPVAITNRILTKAYDLNLSLYRKLYNRFGLLLQSLSDDLNVSVQYYLNGVTSNGDIYVFAFVSILGNSLWDIAKWDIDVWDAVARKEFRVWRKFKRNDKGRKGVHITFNISNSSHDQGFDFKELAFEWAALNERHTSNI